MSWLKIFSHICSCLLKPPVILHSKPSKPRLHRVTVRRVAKNRLRIGPIEAIDGTPVIDIKPVLSGLQDF
jgi:tRNA-methyltransferase O